VERRGPAVCSVSDNMEGKDEMTKASVSLQDLRRRIYVKAKAETSWRFWGLRCEPGNGRASAGRDGIGIGCTKLSGCSTAIGLYCLPRKSLPQDRSYKP
jgi:hypothetical protein